MASEHDKHVVQRVLEDVDGIELRTYSGRGMDGKQCLGAVVDNERKFLVYLVEMALDLGYQQRDAQEVGSTRDAPSEERADQDVQDFRRAVSGLRSDSMGQNTIYYFPNVLFFGE
jgi:hypothetical protein